MTIDKYKKITDLGLKVYEPSAYKDFVYADDLLEVLNQGVDVYGFKIENKWRFSDSKKFITSHTALVIGIKELKPKEVTFTREKLEETLIKTCGMMDYNTVCEIVRKLGL